MFQVFCFAISLDSSFSFSFSLFHTHFVSVFTYKFRPLQRLISIFATCVYVCIENYYLTFFFLASRRRRCAVHTKMLTIFFILIKNEMFTAIIIVFLSVCVCVCDCAFVCRKKTPFVYLSFLFIDDDMAANMRQSIN